MGNDGGIGVGHQGRGRVLLEPPLPEGIISERKEEEEEGEVDNEVLATTVVQASASSNPTRCPGGVEGSDVSVAAPVATFR